MSRFEGKRILITGGTSGIGLAGAMRVAGEGGEVALTGTNPERLEKTRRLIPSAVIIRNDAADAASGDMLAREIGNKLPGLDGLWLNAGFADIAPDEEIDAAFFDRMMNVNVRGPVLQLARLAGLLNEKASVVVTSSTAAYEGAAMASVYSATKGAVVSLVRCWASALAARRIRVNALVPGPMDTHFRDFMPADLRKQFESDVLSRLPLGRIGAADEAAAVALFLLSDDASFVTGSEYVVDGGLTKR
ncbi:SDR family oxidoreductase [Luteimonas suaedae]|uniref:SDR family oxidoreductase n=1 Tax=Luteimonas suaedae TaxID=2605430 RepID=UPI0011EEF954|nr:SDR family oxidoreductase [Luteimonas suaedae]